MKNVFILVPVLFLSCAISRAQSVSINTDASAPDASAILDVKSNSKGFLAPRMTEAERTAIVSPAKGLLVYQTDGTEGYYYNSGTALTPQWSKVTYDKAAFAFSAVSAVSQVISGGSFVKVQFNTEEYDESGNFVPGVTSEFTAPAAGLYNFSAAIVFGGSTGSRYDLAFFVNGVQKKSVLLFLNSPYTSLTLSGDFKLSQNDKVDVRALAPSPMTILNSSPQWIYFSGHKIN